jgi:hypothetical protein
MTIRRASLKLLALVLAAGFAFAATAAPASAATKSRVNALFCAEAGGQWTIPAGTEVQVRLGWLVRNRGLATDFIHAQRTSISVNGGSAVDISGLWSTPEPLNVDPYGTIWFTVVSYDTGIVLEQGETMHFQFVLAEQHLLLDLLTFENGVAGQPVLFQPAVYTYDCTVTGM